MCSIQIQTRTFENLCPQRWINAVFSAKEAEEEEEGGDDDDDEEEEPDDIDFHLERELRQIGVCVCVCVCRCCVCVCI